MSEKYLIFGDGDEPEISEYNPLLQQNNSHENNSHASAYTEAPSPESSNANAYALAPSYDNFSANSDAVNARTERKPKKAVQYVTRRFFASMLALGMLFSTVAGAGIATYLDRDGSPVQAEYENLTGSTGVSEKGALTIEQIVNKNADAVVEINTQVTTFGMFGNGVAEGAGSGVIVNSDGYIVTNYHVIENATSISVTLHSGEVAAAQVIGSDPQNDIAVIKIHANDLSCVTIGKSSDLKVGQLTVAIGNPLGQLGGTATQGIISALDRKIVIDGRELTLLQTDSAINPGNSGGGLFNQKGELIGIVVAKSAATGVEGLGFAIPIDKVAPIIDQLIKYGKVTDRPAAGIKIYQVAEDQLERFEVDAPGVYVGEIYGENVKAAGLELGDRIIALDGKEIESSAALIAEIQTHKIGDEVTLTVVRDGKEIDITFALEDSSKFNS